MNQKGFATSILIYTILGIFLVVTATMMISVRNSQSLNNAIKSDIMNDDIELTANKIFFHKTVIKQLDCQKYDHTYDNLLISIDNDGECTNGVCPNLQCALDYLYDIFDGSDE